MDPRKLSVKELVSYCLDSQDETAWKEFVCRFQPLIAGVATKCVLKRIHSKPDLIDDLVHDTYLKLISNNYKALRNFDFQHDNAFFGFLKVVAANVVEDYFREKNSQKHNCGREEEDIDDVRSAISANPRSSNPAELSILIREIEECLAKRKEDANFTRDYTIFWLYYRQGLTAKAISKLPGINQSVKGVESTLLRLTRFVKATLNEPEPPTPAKKKAFRG